MPPAKASSVILTAAVESQLAATRDSVINPEAEAEESTQRGLFVKVTYVATLAAIITSLLLLWFQISADSDDKELLISVPSALTLAWSILVVFQRKKLNEMQTFRDEMNKARHAVNDVQRENVRLKASVDKFAASEAKLAKTSQQLEEIASKSGKTVDQVTDATKMNEKLLQQLKEVIQGQVLQEVMRITLKSDRDKDYVLGVNELEILIVRMDLVAGIEFHEDRFRKWAAENAPITIKEILDVCRNLLDDTIPEEENFFDVDPSLL
uniref:Uncharacterized protein n=1 Tax=Leptocylindrus danicus TaxID=163516 RepID=A0A7S2JPR6_9STRA|mmetsp:Transcript_1016/g.1441  ORF Transcript_1016/g.1441 Transcript_1016/m.1441 type:complete len:267 (+) Transcript_1016:96-896(+)|eukprot:CAMPEP_0116004630 /NCGR_PEP_ID=MMETSP0321-20121206/708_1 /TAXON_ID=163516 /ORGANISM="Leptocylindrus danicus var. danicus, Strain B650" /LENGTH=266 /DNA_ID=CAMNT_0003472951 /DNA_START=218 /DNA_END=1018 /DNA_ORIENTATION=-